jgi:hypothetical protein
MSARDLAAAAPAATPTGGSNAVDGTLPTETREGAIASDQALFRPPTISSVGVLLQFGVQRYLRVEYLRDWTIFFGGAGELLELRFVEVRHAGAQRQR